MFQHKNNRFFMNDENGKMVAEITYSVSDKIIIIDHTFVDPSLRGQGIASKLVDSVVELAKKENKKIIPLCPYTKKLFENSETYQKIWYR
ncbi:MAG: GNAT family N-acetyltransferase [Acholeplasmataceae bacterium]|nr:GNAT family N-acetyltransferase [Acholeplasmataceae bacterium]